MQRNALLTLFAAMIAILLTMPSCSSQEPGSTANLNDTAQAVGVGGFGNENAIFIDPVYVENSAAGAAHRATLASFLTTLYTNYHVNKIIVPVGHIQKAGTVGMTPTSTAGVLSSGIVPFLDEVQNWNNTNALGVYMNTAALFNIDLQCSATFANQTYSSCPLDASYVYLSTPAFSAVIASNVVTAIRTNYTGTSGETFDFIAVEASPAGDPSHLSGSTKIAPNNAYRFIGLLEQIKLAQFAPGPMSVMAIAPRYECGRVEATYLSGTVFNASACTFYNVNAWTADHFYQATKHCQAIVAKPVDLGATSQTIYNNIVKATAYFGAMAVSGEYWMAQSPPAAGHPWNTTPVRPGYNTQQFFVALPAYAPLTAAHNSYETIPQAAPAGLAGFTLPIYSQLWTGGGALYKYKSGVTCASTGNVEPCDPTTNQGALASDLANWQTHWAGP